MPVHLDTSVASTPTRSHPLGTIGSIDAHEGISYAVAPPANMSNNESRNGTPTQAIPAVPAALTIPEQQEPADAAASQPPTPNLAREMLVASAQFSAAREGSSRESSVGPIQRRLNNRQQRASRSNAPSGASTPHGEADQNGARGLSISRALSRLSTGRTGDAVVLVDDGDAVDVVHRSRQGVPEAASTVPPQGGEY